MKKDNWASSVISNAICFVVCDVRKIDRHKPLKVNEDVIRKLHNYLRYLLNTGVVQQQ